MSVQLVSTGVQFPDASVQTRSMLTTDTGSAKLPSGTTAQRDGTPAAGYIRWNSTLNQYEGYTGTEWAAISGGAKAGANTDITSLGGLTSSVKAASGTIHKADPTTVAFTKLTAGTAEIKAGTVVDVDGTIVSFATATAITMPALTAGTDYAIYACADGTLRADASFSAPSGYTTANSRKIGGFHYAPGGNATGVAGGDATPAINAYSFWDLKFKPSCPDPRGMALVAGGFWVDIYLTGVDAITNGTSKYNVTIADGSSPPRFHRCLAAMAQRPTARSHGLRPWSWQPHLASAACRSKNSWLPCTARLRQPKAAAQTCPPRE